MNLLIKEKYRYKLCHVWFNYVFIKIYTLTFHPTSYEIDCHIINLITRKIERKKYNKTFFKREGKGRIDTNKKGSINVIVCESRLPLNCSFKTSVLWSIFIVIISYLLHRLLLKTNVNHEPSFFIGKIEHLQITY